MGMFRIAKPISAASASVFKRLMSVVRTLSGLVALLSLRKETPPAAKPVPPVGPMGTPTRPVPVESLKAAPNRSEWDQLVRGIVLHAKQEIAEILPGWLIDIHAFESMGKQCYEFVIRAETPPIQGHSGREWGGRYAVSLSEIHRSKSKAVLAQSVFTKLCGIARDIQCKASPAPEVNYL